MGPVVNVRFDHRFLVRLDHKLKNVVAPVNQYKEAQLVSLDPKGNMIPFTGTLLPGYDMVEIVREKEKLDNPLQNNNLIYGEVAIINPSSILQLKKWGYEKFKKNK